MSETEGTSRILVIDDDETIRNLIVNALTFQGYVVDVAQNGIEAIRHTQKNTYDLAIVDIRLPDVNGTELLTLMKDTTPKMAKIILTGKPDLENAIDAVNNGADCYLTKPIQFDRLLDTVKRILKKHQEQEEFTEEKVAEYIDTRLRKLQVSRLSMQ